MANFSKSEVVLVRYPFSDLSNSKVRPAVIVGTQEDSKDVFIVPLTSKLSSLLSGEFILWVGGHDKWSINLKSDKRDGG